VVDDLPGHFQSVVSLRRALWSNRLKAIDILDIHLERFRRTNAALNAIVYLDANGALQSSLALDEQIARCREEALRDRLLAGIPVTVKDHIAAAGMPLTAGDPGRRGNISRRDSPVVARLRCGAATLLGKTNQPLGGTDWQTHNALYGITENPWRRGYTPGGSSGAGAASVAAGLSGVDFGSDTSGSLRIPASFCGVYAHRPSRGLLPRQWARAARARDAGPALMEIGPIARSAEDLALALRAAASVPVRGSGLATLTGVRAVFLPMPRWCPVDAEIAQAYEDLAHLLARKGALVQWRPTAAGWNARAIRDLPRSYGRLQRGIDDRGSTSRLRGNAAADRRLAGRVVGPRADIHAAAGVAAARTTGTIPRRAARLLRRRKSSYQPRRPGEGISA
jgi:amidase